MSNHAQSDVRFEMDPMELFQFFRSLRATENVHLGIYHSHPSTEAYPSTTDVQESFYPDCSYFIVSLKDPEAPQVRAFQIEDKKIHSLEISELD